MSKHAIGTLLLLTAALALTAAESSTERNAAIQKKRAGILIPQALDQHDIDLWIVFTREATDKAIAAMRPGVTGNHIDGIARETLTTAGYEGYPHAAGHPIGFDVHDVGPLLGPDWKERYGSTVFLKLEPGQTFAVEPILYAGYKGVPLSIGLEEDVVITETGAERLHRRLDDLIVITPPEI